VTGAAAGTGPRYNSGAMAHELVIRDGTVVTATETFRCDVGVDGGRITALGEGLPPGGRELDARGLYVLPGGIDSHVHIDQLSSAGVVCADDFHSGTVSAAFGGTTTVIPFAAQHRGMKLRAVVEDYHRRAAAKAVIDYGFHLIVADPTEEALRADLPRLVAEGITSLKVYMTYERLRLGDEQLLDVLAAARRLGALTMIHAENHGMIAWLSHHLVHAGATAPRYHAIAHPRVAEGEAVQRAIALAELVDVPILIVHVSDAAGATAIREAQARGLRVYGETCPQYLFLTADDLDRPGLEGAKYGCSPPPRDRVAQEAIWAGLANGTFQAYSSDHAPYRFDESGKLPKGDRTTFKDMANGVPGLELRLPLLFSEGVGRSRLSLNEFVAVGATNHAQLYGLYPRKGTIAPGSDADLALWDPEHRVRVTAPMLHDRVGYTPYEGRELTGWPVTVLARGRVIVQDGRLHAEPGTGQFVPSALADWARPRGVPVPELERLRQLGPALDL
jgi:dihydropyrimidinase